VESKLEALVFTRAAVRLTAESAFRDLDPQQQLLALVSVAQKSLKEVQMKANAQPKPRRKGILGNDRNDKLTPKEAA